MIWHNRVALAGDLIVVLNFGTFVPPSTDVNSSALSSSARRIYGPTINTVCAWNVKHVTLLCGGGYLVVCAAGSKSVADFAAINDHEVRLIQVKWQGAQRPVDRQALSVLRMPRNTRLEIGGCAAA